MILATFLRRLLPSPRLLRLTLYLTGVFCVLSFTSARLLHAQVREALLGLGQQLSGLKELTQDSETLLVNGQRFHHALVTREESLDAVLDRVERHCSGNPGLLTQSLVSAAATQRVRLPEWAQRGSVLREQAGSKGLVVCFVRSGREREWDLATALERLISQSDATELGAVIYTFAEHAHGRTRVSTIWTDSGLNLFDLFAGDAEAPGPDSAFLPRPPRSHRTLVAAAENTAFAVRVYQSSESLETIRAFYAEAMRRRAARPVAENRDYDTTAFLSDSGRLAFVSLSVIENRTYVTLTESDQRDAVVSATAEP